MCAAYKRHAEILVFFKHIYQFFHIADVDTLA